MKKIFGQILSKKDDEKDTSTVKPAVAGRSAKKETTENVTTKKPQIVEKVIEKPDVIKADSSTDQYKAKPKFFYKPLVDKKLTVILVENTTEVAEQKGVLIEIAKSLGKTGLVSVINYGSTVRQSEIFDVSSFNNDVLVCNTDAGDMACLYDALVNLEILISEKHMHIEEKEKERIRINKIEVIGIGTCRDNGSKVSKEVGLDCFCRVATKPQVVTKYYCLTEEFFMNAAEVGFHSIGAIFKSY